MANEQDTAATAGGGNALQEALIDHVAGAVDASRKQTTRQLIVACILMLSERVVKPRCVFRAHISSLPRWGPSADLGEAFGCGPCQRGALERGGHPSGAPVAAYRDEWMLGAAGLVRIRQEAGAADYLTVGDSHEHRVRIGDPVLLPLLQRWGSYRSVP